LKPYFYKDPCGIDRSFSTNEVRSSEFGFGWHFHPECQFKLTLAGEGYRIVGDSIAPVAPEDLVFTGPNLPHAWRNDPAAPPQRVHFVTVLFREDCLGAGFFDRPELAELQRVIRLAVRGIEFRGVTRRRIAHEMRLCLHAEGLNRVRHLLNMLETAAASQEYRLLSSAGFQPAPNPEDAERMTRICAYIETHLAEPITREQAAGIACLSPAAFSRYFHAHTGKTLPEFLRELRVGRACRLLVEDAAAVTEIAFACGFNSLATFNRQFRQLKQAPPTEFRRRFRTVGTAEAGTGLPSAIPGET
jgi:AraC-like DNA-binding protein